MTRRAIGTVSVAALLALGSVTGALAQQTPNPRAPKNPCAGTTRNPCAVKNPCAAKKPPAAKRPQPSHDPLTARTGIPNEFDGYIHSGSGR